MIRRLLAAPVALAIVAVSVVAAPAISQTGSVASPSHAYAAACSTPSKTGSNCGVPASVTINPGSGTLTFTVLNGLQYNSLKNTGGSTPVTCTQNVSATTQTSTSTYLIQYVGSSKSQVTYLLCLASYQVSDFSGTGNGWRVTFQEGQWTCTTVNGSTGGCTSGATIAAGSTYMDVPQVTCSNPPGECTGNGTPPAIKMTGAVPIDKGAVVVASAAVHQGMGGYVFAPRTDTCGGTNTICQTSTGSTPTTASQGQLSLYAPNTTKNGYYKSTLTESLTSGP